MNRRIICYASALSAGASIQFAANQVPNCMWALLVLLCMDMITGMIFARINKTLSSSVCARGIAKKIGILGVITAAFCIDKTLGVDTFFQMCVFFYIASETLSIVENCAKIGVPVPEKLKDALDALKK